MSKLKIVDKTQDTVNTTNTMFGDLGVGETFMFAGAYSGELFIKISDERFFNLQTCRIHGAIDKANKVIRKECELVIKH